MIRVDLTLTEQEILAEILEGDLSDLSMEIADTEKMNFRENLKLKKQVLKKTLRALREPS